MERFLNFRSSNQVAARILEAHSSLNLMTVMEAKMNYIRKWQELPDFGITHYGVKFRGEKISKKDVSYSAVKMNKKCARIFVIVYVSSFCLTEM